MIELAYKYIVLNQGKKSPLPVTREKKIDMFIQYVKQLHYQDNLFVYLPLLKHIG